MSNAEEAPADTQEDLEFFVEALTEGHDRSAFSCGIDQVDNFFQKTAGKLDRAGNTRVRVMVNRDGVIVGFYAINAHAVDYTVLPKSFARAAPAHGSIPAAFIAMIGRDQKYRGQSIGQDLLIDALLSIEKVAETLGVNVAILDVLDCGNSAKVQNRLAIYNQFGFRPLESNPLRLFLPVKNISKAIEEALKDDEKK